MGGAILSFVLFQGLLSASLDCEDAAEGVSEALTTCQTKCPVVLLSAAVTDPIWLLWFGEKSSPSCVKHYPSAFETLKAFGNLEGVFEPLVSQIPALGSLGCCHRGSFRVGSWEPCPALWG